MNTGKGTLLENVQLFSGLPAQQLAAIERLGVRRTIPKNTLFIEKGDKASNLYLILSGKVKVYLPDAQGNQRVLNVQGPGDHLGELALMGDSVRSACVMTLEDSTFLVLTRRAFMECVYCNPQIALNLDSSLVTRSIEENLGRAAAERYRVWSTFRRSGLPLIILIGGCTGTGKSTVAAELSLRLDIGRTQSTDILRDVMRLFVSEDEAPELHTSSYDAWQTLPGPVRKSSNEGAPLIEGYLAQAARLAVAVDGVIARSIKERASTIIEGIHVHPAYHQRCSEHDAVFVPVLITIPGPEDLKQHFVRRGEQSPSRSASRYLENFDSIWQLQAYFTDEAKRCGVPVIPNIDLEQTLSRVMEVITQRLAERFAVPTPD
jgi:2-phosphoglycerate kinase